MPAARKGKFPGKKPARRHRGRASDGAPREPVAAPFPLVGVGASAGGLEAFIELLAHLPPNSGMAFVLVLHIDPRHPSLLAETVARATAMVVREAQDGMVIEPDHVYVIPPSAELGTRAGRLEVVACRAPGTRPRLAIDGFFTSLARDRGDRAIGVLLSGTASDGTGGLGAIKAAGGITLAQDPMAARFPAMPRAAIEAGVVDLVLPIPELARELVRPRVGAARLPRAAALLARESGLPAGRPVDLERLFDRLLLARHAPTGVLLDERLEVLSFRGETGAYLRPAPGRPQHNVLKMARPGLVAALRDAVGEARTSGAPVTRAVAPGGGLTAACNLIVIPCDAVPGKVYAVLFEPAARPARRPSAARAAGGADKLRTELEATRDYLQALNEQHAHMNEELEAANAELGAANEELQSMNEELEIAKEELQSTNEELTTVNDELRGNNGELVQLNGDLVNLIATVDFPIVFLDRERRIRRFTPAARSLLAVLPADVGRRMEDLKLHVDVPDLEGRIAAVIEGGAIEEEEVEDRAGRWHRLQIRPYLTALGRIDGAVVSLVDIDALKRHAGDADRARGEAEKANRAKDQFLALLSHELRTPLSTMLMQSQLIQRGDMDGARLKRAGQAIERGTRLQVRLIDDLLDISRIVTGKLRIEREVVDLAAVVRAALESVAAPAAAKSLRLEVAVDDATGVVHGDPARLQQVVTNLLGNAIKFSSQGGLVTVELARVDGRALLTVSDFGQGIDPAFLPHVWNRFSQEDSTSTRSFGGLGLGLAIVRHLVEVHGGTASAASPGPGKGATFSVDLPLLARGEAALAAGSDGSPRPADGALARSGELRILIVDDDAGTREVVAEMLRRLGAEVRVTESAHEALEAMGEQRPSVVVCDIVMPEKDGLTFIKQLRQLGPERGGDVPALALTALAGDEDRQRSLAAGFQMHLTKPVDIERLAAALATLASNGRPVSA